MAADLVRYRIRPQGSWVSAWQTDTVMGALACHCVREYGADSFVERLATGWAQGRPPFVISDAFPGDLLPAPTCLALLGWPESQRRLASQTEWLPPEQFSAMQCGRQPELPDPKIDPFRRFVRLRNVADREVGSTGESGELYTVPSVCLEDEIEHLSLYARVEDSARDLLADLLASLARSGFGADAAVGQGQFDLLDLGEPVNWLDAVDGADAWISLSTFQPQSTDPTEGYWKSFVKYGRLGPDLNVAGVFKRPQWMLTPGACFLTREKPRPWYGGVIQTQDLLPAGTLAEMEPNGAMPVQPAFALAIPMKWRSDLNY